MKLGLAVEYAGRGVDIPIPLIQHCEELGYDSVWTAEAYGSDAITPLAFIAAHTKRIRLGTGVIQLAARTPAMAAMQLGTVDAMAGGGRVIGGIGVSGPQIVEGWYGMPWGNPKERMRDYVTIMKKIFAREEPVTHAGSEIALPYEGPGSAGMAKPLKSILHYPDRPRLWLGTGAKATVELMRELGAEVVGAAFLVELGFLAALDGLQAAGDLVEADRLVAGALLDRAVAFLEEPDQSVVAGDGLDLAGERDDLGLELGALGFQLVLELLETSGLLLQVLQVVPGVRGAVGVGQARVAHLGQAQAGTLRGVAVVVDHDRGEACASALAVREGDELGFQGLDVLVHQGDDAPRDDRLFLELAHLLLQVSEVSLNLGDALGILLLHLAQLRAEGFGIGDLLVDGLEHVVAKLVDHRVTAMLAHEGVGAGAGQTQEDRRDECDFEGLFDEAEHGEVPCVRCSFRPGVPGGIFPAHPVLGNLRRALAHSGPTPPKTSEYSRAIMVN